jgi:hypothetical protein
MYNIISVAKGPKFRPQSSKGAEKNLMGLGKSGAELLPDLSKKGRQGAELFLDLVFHKIIYISCQNSAYKLVYLIFPYRFGSWTIEKTAKLAFVSQFYVGAELFRQRPNFLADLAENS